MFPSITEQWAGKQLQPQPPVSLSFLHHHMKTLSNIMFGPLTKSIPLPHPLSLLLFCTGLSDSEHWLQHRDLPPGVNPVLGPAAAEGPAPVAGPRVGPVNTPDDFAEPRGPNVPMLARPPIKVQQLF